MVSFSSRYGPWAVVAGASAGIGAAFAEALAERAVNLVMIARGEARLKEIRRAIETNFGVATKVLKADLADSDSLTALERETRDLDVGLLVYNATFPVIGPFLERPLDEHMRLIDVNCRAPLRFVHHWGRRFGQRGRGGILLMSSMASFQGTPYISHYGASKAYNLVLGEGLWYELRDAGIDVTVCCAGATDTPNFRASLGSRTAPSFPPVMEPGGVVKEALGALGKRPVIVPGRMNRLAAFLMRRIVPRRVSISMMGRATRNLYL
jgi:short-subunit dehydrogenase